MDAPFARLLALLTPLAVACSSGGSSDALRITTSPATDAVAGEAYAYTASAAHAKGSVVWALTSAPAGMTVSAGGVVSWSPTQADLGTTTVTLQATDDARSVAQSWDLRTSQGVLLGTTLSQRGHLNHSTAQDYVDYYGGHAPWGEVIAFHSRWRDSVSAAGALPLVAETGLQAAASFGFTPAIGIGWTEGDGTPFLTSDGDPADNSWSNAETRAEFLAMLDTLVATYEPPYLFLGNETNAYYLTHTQTEWDEWIEVFEEAYDRIKALSPDTLVSTVFQYERMKGLGSGTTGWTDPPHFDLIDDHVAGGKIDAIAFTSYPYFEYATPATIPADYYDDVAPHWSGPVIFTEIGWLASAEPPYPGGSADQEAFVDVFFDRTASLPLAYVTWLFLHDYDDPGSITGFGSIGLRSNDGSVVRPSDAAWQAAVALRER